MVTEAKKGPPSANTLEGAGGPCEGTGNNSNPTRAGEFVEGDFVPAGTRIARVSFPRAAGAGRPVGLLVGPPAAPPGLSAVDVEKGVVPLGTVCIRPDFPLRGDAKVYPYGVVLRTDCGLYKPKKGKHLCGFKRGRISGFSPESAARCRLFAVSHTVPGARLVSLTGTTADPRGPVEWRKIMERFHDRIDRRLVAAIWRVELQKRKAPHAHMMLWVPSDVEGWAEFLRSTWLQCIGGHDLRGLVRGEADHAVMLQEGVDAGWVSYLAAHSSKHKVTQLGWLGKQWGVWGQSRFVEIPDVGRTPLSGPAMAMVKRGLRRWREASINRQRGIEEARALASLRRSYPLAEVYVIPRRRVKVKPLPCVGCVVRAYAPEVPSRLIAWAVQRCAETSGES